MGLSSAQAQQLADRLRLIPGNYTARIVADTGAAQLALAHFRQ